VSRTAYLDASALVKLVVREPESDDLERFLDDVSDAVTSVISFTEVPRAARRITGQLSAVETAEAVVVRCTAVDFDKVARQAAARAAPPELASLDAIHLVSALRVQHVLDAFVTYDRRLAAAARGAGLTAVSPGRDT
jgi:hypothetical protein